MRQARPSFGESSRSAVELLELARSLARKAEAAKSTPVEQDPHSPEGGEKGDKCEKPPSNHTRVSLPEMFISTDDPEVAWRARAMWARVHPGSPIPFLAARDVPVVDGACLSCGVPLAQEERYRCSTCLKAAILILAALRGDVSSGGTRR